jgi:hypothetical protein
MAYIIPATPSIGEECALCFRAFDPQARWDQRAVTHIRDDNGELATHFIHASCLNQSLRRIEGAYAGRCPYDGMLLPNPEYLTPRLEKWAARAEAFFLNGLIAIPTHVVPATSLLWLKKQLKGSSFDLEALSIAVVTAATLYPQARIRLGILARKVAAAIENWDGDQWAQILGALATAILFIDVSRNESKALPLQIAVTSITGILTTAIAAAWRAD